MTVCYSDDGNYHMTTMTKATLYHHGLVKWEPPAIFKSSCDIDVRYTKTRNKRTTNVPYVQSMWQCCGIFFYQIRLLKCIYI